MNINLEKLKEIQEDLFKQQCNLDIQKAMLKHFIKKEKDEQLTLTDVVSTLFCDCEIPKPIDPFDVVDKNICSDCKEIIAK